MKNNKLLWSLSALSVLLAAGAMPFIADTVPMHFGPGGVADRYGSKYESFIFPAFILVMALFWTLLMRYYEKKAASGADDKVTAEARTNLSILRIVAVATTVLFLVMEVVFLLFVRRGGEAGGEPAVLTDWFNRAIMSGLGLLCIVFGNYMPKAKPNGIFGLRTGWSTADDKTWAESNRFGGVLLVAAGVAAIAAIWAFNGMTGYFIGLAAILVAAIAGTVYSYLAYKRNNK